MFTQRTTSCPLKRWNWEEGSFPGLVKSGKVEGIYGATDAVAAERALEALEQSALGQRYPVVAQTWRRAWAQVIPFFNFPPEVRKLIYTTNSIEGLNRAIRNVIKTRTLFPNKLIYLAIQGFTEEWKRPTQRWAAAMPFFAIRYGERFTGAAL